jgi:hypothetical protein
MARAHTPPPKAEPERDGEGSAGSIDSGMTGFDTFLPKAASSIFARRLAEASPAADMAADASGEVDNPKRESLSSQKHHARDSR